MKNLQVAKVEYGSHKSRHFVYFNQELTDPGYARAQAFFEKMKQKYHKVSLYHRNFSSYGDTWIRVEYQNEIHPLKENTMIKLIDLYKSELYCQGLHSLAIHCFLEDYQAALQTTKELDYMYDAETGSIIIDTSSFPTYVTKNALTVTMKYLHYSSSLKAHIKDSMLYLQYNLKTIDATYLKDRGVGVSKELLVEATPEETPTTEDATSSFLL